VAVVDTPSLERFFIWRCLNQRHAGRVKIGHAPRLSMLGYLEPGVHVLEIGNTVIKVSISQFPFLSFVLSIIGMHALEISANRGA
jgi:hypothetical protein